MTITKLTRTDLAPDLEAYQALFAQAELSHPAPSLSGDLQPRLFYGLEQLLYTPAVSSFMLVKAPEEPEYLQWLAAETRTLHEPAAPLYGVRYEVTDAQVTLAPAQGAEDNFASTAPVVMADWVEAEQLFGCVRQFNGAITLQPGLVHQANGGVLVLSLRTLLAQPLLWVRLKNMVTRQRFDWLSMDESRPLPVSIPSMPLSLKIILVGERESLADFQEMEPELAAQAIYSEYEDTLQFADADTLKAWCQWVWQNAQQLALPGPAADAWPLLIDEGTRYTGDQETLPL
ncbi:AAA family ATPase, partial [Klebsiella pneumoniae]